MEAPPEADTRPPITCGIDSEPEPDRPTTNPRVSPEMPRVPDPDRCARGALTDRTPEPDSAAPYSYVAPPSAASDPLPDRAAWKRATKDAAVRAPEPDSATVPPPIGVAARLPDPDSAAASRSALTPVAVRAPEPDSAAVPPIDHALVRLPDPDSAAAPETVTTTGPGNPVALTWRYPR